MKCAYPRHGCSSSSSSSSRSSHCWTCRRSTSISTSCCRRCRCCCRRWHPPQAGSLCQQQGPPAAELLLQCCRQRAKVSELQGCQHSSGQQLCKLTVHLHTADRYGQSSECCHPVQMCCIILGVYQQSPPLWIFGIAPFKRHLHRSHQQHTTTPLNPKQPRVANLAVAGWRCSLTDRRKRAYTCNHPSMKTHHNCGASCTAVALLQ